MKEEIGRREHENQDEEENELENENPDIKVAAPPKQATPEKKPGIGRTLRWAARATSLPVLGLLLISLIPAVANFGTGAKDDKIIAVGLCGICVGFLIAWKWAGIGGLLSLISVGVILSQEEGGLSADPFSVTFGIQGVLFLISWAMGRARKNETGTSVSTLWFKRIAAAALVVCAGAGAVILLRGPAPTPLAKEREAYVGVWDNGSGFRLDLTTDGRAKVSLAKDGKVEPCNTPVQAGGAGEYLAEFHDNRLELKGGLLGEAKIYHIDRRPVRQGKQIKMVLNGSDPFNRNSGMILVKQTAQGTNAPPKTPNPQGQAAKK